MRKKSHVKCALITGITGQDGSYLAELLLDKGYAVHGIVRHVELENYERRLWRLRDVIDGITLHSGSIESYASIFRIIGKVRPDECYHLAAQSFVSYSFEDDFSTIHTNGDSTYHILSAIKELAPRCRFYYAGSSEMFGRTTSAPQNEHTPFRPRSPYGISKVVGFDLTRNYREVYGLFACSGILFNHESPRRGFEFVTRKISVGVAEIKLGMAKELRLGNLTARRDWGFAGDYVRAMWLMLQQKKPDDYVIAMGRDYAVQEFVAEAFRYVGLDWKRYVTIDKTFYRPAEKTLLSGDSRKARRVLGWKPTVGFKDLVHMMVDADIERLRSERIGAVGMRG